MAKLRPTSARALAATVALIAIVAVPLFAQRQMSVAQLEQFIRSAIQQNQKDGQVADVLKNFRMSERLTAGEVETLQGLGAGPRTLEMLRKMSTESAALGAAVPPPDPEKALAPLPVPSDAEWHRTLQAVTRYALDYTEKLPNFICTQVTQRYRSFGPVGDLRLVDEIQEQLAFVDGDENYKVVMVNRQVVNNISHEQLGGAITRGEFGSRLFEIFRPESKTEFQWQRWATLRSRRMHVFAFRVKQENSAFTMFDEASGRRMIGGYHGEIYADAENNAVMRVRMVVDGLQNFPIREVESTLDYDFAEIAGVEYILPLRAELNSKGVDYATRNRVRFQLYNRFTTDATIIFETPADIPEDQLEEQPAK